jgi:predicted TIM-barrel fold metal-dependent hydrolase
MCRRVYHHVDVRVYRYISGDSHLEIDSKHWLPRVPEKFRDRAPRLVKLDDGADAWVVEDEPPREVPSDLYGGKGRGRWRPFGQAYETTAGTGPPEQRLREQDQDGIDAEVLFPGASGPRLWRRIKDDEAYKSVVRAYNDFLAEDYCAVARDRLIGLGVLPWTGVDDAIAEMEHCARAGLKGVCLGVFPSGKSYPTAEDDRFWAAALDMRMPVTIHVELTRSGGPLVKYPAGTPEVLERIGPRRDFAQELCKFARSGGVNAVQLIMSGVFDRFPELRIFFAENQIGWIPLFMEVADSRYERHLPWAEELLGFKRLPRLPSEYIRDHCYWGFQHDRVGVELRHRLNHERLIWASDFPHQESDWPNSMRIVEENFAGVPEDERRAMVAGNAIEFFQL